MNASIRLRDEYIKLLGDELNDLIGVAMVHGWKSERHEAGMELRKKIAEADDEQRCCSGCKWWGAGTELWNEFPEHKTCSENELDGVEICGLDTEKTFPVFHKDFGCIHWSKK